MNKIIIVCLFVMVGGCSKKEAEPTKCQETYSRLIQCYPAQLRDISKRKFISLCELSETPAYVGMGNCYLFDKCADVLNCVSVLSR